MPKQDRLTGSLSQKKRWGKYFINGEVGKIFILLIK